HPGRAPDGPCVASGGRRSHARPGCGPWWKGTRPGRATPRPGAVGVPVLQQFRLVLSYPIIRLSMRETSFGYPGRSKPYPQSLLERMAETSGIILKARALVTLGMPELALSAWLAAAAGEEQTAPRLETLHRDREAAVHRISAASCYQHAGELAKAINLYRAAL